MGKFAIILSSHGFYAQEAMKSAEMIVGKQENFATVSITPDKNLESALEELKKVYSKLDKSNGTLIMTDIIGGTPSNICGNLMLSNDNVLLYSGFNLPVLIDVLLNRDKSLEDIGKRIEGTYKESLFNLNDLMKGSVDDDQVD